MSSKSSSQATNPRLKNVGGFDDVCVGRSASGVVREARAVGATEAARDHGARGDVFGHLGEKLAAVAGERVRGDDGELTQSVVNVESTGGGGGGGGSGSTTTIPTTTTAAREGRGRRNTRC